MAWCTCDGHVTSIQAVNGRIQYFLNTSTATDDDHAAIPNACSSGEFHSVTLQVLNYSVKVGQL